MVSQEDVKFLTNMVCGAAAFAVLLAALFFGTAWLYRHYQLWSVEYAGRALEIERTYEGKAILAQAENARMARVSQAKAELEAAELTASAIRTVGEAAQQYPEYRQQEFFLSLGEALREGQIEQVIYLPTEAALPLTEAGKRQ